MVKNRLQSLKSETSSDASSEPGLERASCNSSVGVSYSPEDAFDRATRVINAIAKNIKRLKLKGGTREEVWQEEVARFEFLFFILYTSYMHSVYLIEHHLLRWSQYVVVSGF